MISYLLQETHGKDLLDGVVDNEGPVDLECSVGKIEEKTNQNSGADVVSVTT